jgi:hypothetical protein
MLRFPRSMSVGTAPVLGSRHAKETSLFVFLASLVLSSDTP